MLFVVELVSSTNGMGSRIVRDSSFLRIACRFIQCKFSHFDASLFLRIESSCFISNRPNILSGTHKYKKSNLFGPQREYRAFNHFSCYFIFTDSLIFFEPWKKTFAVGRSELISSESSGILYSSVSVELLRTLQKCIANLTDRF